MSISQKKLKISIISQEKKLLSLLADSLTAQTSSGQVTILPQHIPLFTRLERGELVYRVDGKEELFAVSQGFLDVGPDNEITVIVDSVVEAREISMAAAEAAVKAAESSMAAATNREELILAEASLRQALLEVKIARKTKRTTL